MNIEAFIEFLKEQKIKYQKHYDDICVGNIIYQFDKYGNLFSKVVIKWRFYEVISMMYLEELIKKNGHKLVRYNEGIAGHKYMKVFDYSNKYGGTFDSFKYYNDYYVEIA